MQPEELQIEAGAGFQQLLEANVFRILPEKNLKTVSVIGRT